MDMHLPAQAEAPRLLTDAQIRQFLANGYLVLQTALPKSFHDQVFQRFDDLIGADRHEPLIVWLTLKMFRAEKTKPPVGRPTGG